MSTPEAKKRDGLNYKVVISQAPVKKTGANGPYVEAKGKTMIKGAEKEITLRAFQNTDEDGKVSKKSQQRMKALATKKVGDKSNLFGKVVRWTEKNPAKGAEARKGIYFQVLAVDAQPPKKEKAAPAEIA